MVFGELLDFIDCSTSSTAGGWKPGRAKPLRQWFIDDVIPSGI